MCGAVLFLLLGSCGTSCTLLRTSLFFLTVLCVVGIMGHKLYASQGESLFCHCAVCGAVMLLGSWCTLLRVSLLYHCAVCGAVCCCWDHGVHFSGCCFFITVLCVVVGIMGHKLYASQGESLLHYWAVWLCVAVGIILNNVCAAEVWRKV